MKEKLRGLNGLSIALLVAAMIVFPYGLFTETIAVIVAGWLLLVAGVVTGKVSDRRRSRIQ